MNRLVTAAILLAALGICGSPVGAQTCADPAGGLGVSRVIEIDTTTGALFGENSRFTREPSFLGPKEVVITIDDGPLPAFTRPILDTLDQFCTKATFFAIGQMAFAYPDLVKEEIARGHTVGSHTWSHPMNISRLGLERGIDQIERGHAAVTLAAGQPIAPFFRFPGLNDSNPLLAHLQSRGIAAFTVDVISNDSYIRDPGKLFARTMKEIEKRNGGILLFHDIKASTAKALPDILRALKDGGYQVVHLKTKNTATPVAAIEEQLKPILAKREGGKGEAQTAAATHQLQPFFAPIAMLKPASTEGPEVTALTPQAQDRGPAGKASKSSSITTAAVNSDGDISQPRRTSRARKSTLNNDDQQSGVKPRSKRFSRVKRASAEGRGPMYTYGQ